MADVLKGGFAAGRERGDGPQDAAAAARAAAVWRSRVPAEGEGHGELPLIVFTLCVPCAVGAASVGAVLGLSESTLLAAVVVALTTVGMIASMAHLAAPPRAPTSLRNVSSSWLSREIAAVGAFWACAVVWLAAVLAGAVPSAGMLALQVLCAAAGIGLLFVIARAYKVNTRPAWNGHEGLLEMASCACGAGGAFCCVVMLAQPAAWAEPHMLAACALATVLACVALVLDVRSHGRRRQRLERAADADARASLSLRRYGKLQPVLKKAWVVEGIAVALAFAGLGLVAFVPFPEGVLLAAWSAVLVLELAAHAMQRWLFYELPVPVRYVAPLRK